MLLNKNFRDMLSALNDEGAEYLVVGAYAVGANLPPWATATRYVPIALRVARSGFEGPVNNA